MKLLVVADVYPPEVSSAANLMHELARGFVARGHEVTVITSYPRHYLSEEAKRKAFPEFTHEGGVAVIRAKVLPHHKVNFFIRGISQLILPYIFFRKVTQYVTDIDAVVVYSPPLPLGLLGGMIKRAFGAKFLLNIQDIFPQNAIDLGILKFKPAIWFFEWIEGRVYAAADLITFHSEGGKRFLMEKKGVPPEKIVMFPNWVDLEAYRTHARATSFRKEWELEDKFIFLFAGIFGPAQGLRFLVDVAAAVKDLKDVHFLFVGDGMEKEAIVQDVRARGLANVVIKPFIPQQEYASLAAECNVGLVCLSPQNKTSFVPGKLLGYMASGKPVLAFLNKESDGFHVIEEAQCGYATVAGDVARAAALVRKLYTEKNTLAVMGERGFRYATAHLSLDASVKRLEILLSK